MIRLAATIVMTMLTAHTSLSAEIEAVGPKGPLRGALAGPATGAPVVLIIPGSGPTNRDGDNLLSIKAATYRLLAEGLAAKGVASVRIDKRGMFGSASAVPDANAVTIEDYVRDVDAWIVAIRQRTGAKCVWLVGHSEGGLISLAAAAAQRPDICGLALLATAGRPIGDVLKEQLRANPANAPILAAADQAIDALSKGARVDVSAMPAPLASLFGPRIQGFLISVFSLDPAQLIARIDKPILILQGDKDIQVSVADANRLAKAQPAATLKMLTDVNHVLKTVRSDDRAANLAAYVDPNLPLAPGVVDELAEFVGGRTQIAGPRTLPII